MTNKWPGIVVVLLCSLTQISYGETDFLKLFNSKRFSSVDDFVEFLAQTHKESLKNYLLVRDSHSLQLGTALRPRVIIFSEKTKSILAVNGCAPENPSSYDTIEFINFNDDTAQFEFNSVAFHNNQIADDYQKPDCKSCHHGRPNWDPYPKWPGLYLTEAHSYPVSEYGLPKGQESEDFSAFLKSSLMDNNCRYRFLPDVAGHYDRNADVESDPNTIFSQLIAYLNYQRITREIMSLKEYNLYKFAILAALNECQDIESYIPPFLRDLHEVSYQWYLEDTKKKQNLSMNEFTRRYYFREMAMLRYLLTPFGIDFSTWSTGFSARELTDKSFATEAGLPADFTERHLYSLAMPLGSTEVFLHYLLTSKDQELNEFQKFEVFQNNYYGIGYEDLVRVKDDQEACLELKELSLRRLGG